MDYGEWMEDGAGCSRSSVWRSSPRAFVYAIAVALFDRPGHRHLFDHARRNFGQPFILGLEVLVAADIIETIKQPIKERTNE